MVGRWLIPVLLLGCTDLDGDKKRGGSDCNDADPQVYNDAPELCDGLDNDCDGLIDEDVAFIAYLDRDGDGFGDDSFARRVCVLPANGSETGGDCDDDATGVNPLTPEVCDGIDNDCNGSIDDGVTGTFYVDADGDGSGTGAALPSDSCWPPDGFSADGIDCDDADPLRAPSLVETCDGLDNNCDGAIDEDLPDVLTYLDADGDESGAPGTGETSCGPLNGRVTDGRDCDDADATIGAFAVDIAGNGIDEDCDTYIDELGIPSAYPDLDAALAAAAPGAVVQFEDGTHQVNLDLTGHDVVLAGNGCEHTTLFGTFSGSVVTMDSGILENLTIAGGSGSDWPWVGDPGTHFGGGLIVPEDGVVDVRNACFTGNSANGAGGAIAVLRGGVLSVTDSLFVDNQATRTGGAIFGERAQIDVVRSRFYRNASTSFRGGAIGIHGGELVVRNAEMAYNWSEDGGGAVSIDPVGTDHDTSGVGPFLEESGVADLSFVSVHGSDTTVYARSAFYNRSGLLTLTNSIVTDSTGLVYDSTYSVPIGQTDRVYGSRVFENVALLHHEEFEADGGWITQAVRGDPRFVSLDPTMPDLRLLPDSPFRDVGSGRDRDGSVADLGAWGGLQAATGGADADTDGDGMSDLWEAHRGLIVGIDDSADDPDADGLSNHGELLSGGDPHQADTDGDGVNDNDEVSGNTAPDEGRDRHPHADAGYDQLVLTGSVVTLDGSNSFDPNGDAFTGSWTLDAAPTASAVSAPGDLVGSFTPDVAGTYAFTLTIDDGLANNSHSVRVEAVTGVTVTSTAELHAAAPSHDVIALAPGLYTDVFLDLANQDLTLIGNGAVLEALPGHPHVRALASGSLHLHDLVLSQGRQEDTGLGRGGGGSLFVTDLDHLELSRVRFENSFAEDLGGALYAARIHQGIDFTDVEFVDGEARRGAAFYIIDSPIRAQWLSFLGNRSDDAIVVIDGGDSFDATWSDVQFVGNTTNRLVLVGDEGNGADLEIRHGLFYGNATERALDLRGSPANSPGRADFFGYEILFEANRFTDAAGVPSAAIHGGRYGVMAIEVQEAQLPRLVGASVLESVITRSPADLRPGLFIRDGVSDDVLWGRLGSSVHDAGWLGATDIDGSRSDHALRPRLPRHVRWQLDADADGMSDGWEVHFALDPLTDDRSLDLDADGLTNGEEHAWGTDPSAADTDADGVGDATEASDPSVDPLDPFDNRPIAAVTGPDTVLEGATVVLDGSASADPNGSPLTFHWAVLSVPPGSTLVTLTDDTSSMPSFVADARGAYVIELVVDDGELDSAPVTLSVFAEGTLHVPSNYSAADAFAEARDNETVSFETGSFEIPPVTLAARRLTVTGTGDTTLMATPGRQHFHVEPLADLVLFGVTLRGGVGRLGGAVRCDRGTLTVRDSRFEHNLADLGGALNLVMCPTLLERVDLVDNHAIGNGGALLVSNASLSWIQGAATGNSSGDRGGVFHSNLSSAPAEKIALENLRIEDNRAGNGGAFYVDSSLFEGRHLTALRNLAPNGRGGPVFLNSNVSLSNSVLQENLGSQITALTTGQGFITSLNQVLVWRPDDPANWYTAAGEPGPAVIVADALLQEGSRLGYGSPGIDAGEHLDPDGSAADLGAWGGLTPVGPNGNAFYVDTDGDQIPDSWELAYGLDPNAPSDATLDGDGDTLDNQTEFERGTSPIDTDSDADGVTDGAEVMAGSDPADEEDNRPVAFPGFPGVVDPGTSVQVDGQFSADPNDDPLQWAWSLVGTPASSALTSSDLTPDSPSAVSFTPDVPGAYVLELVVDDGAATSAPAQVVFQATGEVRVPEDYATVDEAVSAVAPGSLVRVGAGTWPSSGLSLDGKDIEILGAGAGVTVVDLEGSAGWLDASLGEQVRIEGLTTTGGFALRGGAFEIGGVNSGQPGGLRGRLELVDVDLQSLVAVEGGAIHAVDADVLLTQVRATDNRSGHHGGAVSIDVGAFDGVNTFWAGNQAHDGDGGALFIKRSTGVFRNAVFAENHAVRGGGLATDGTASATVDLRFITAAHNTAIAQSGFLHLRYSEASVLSHALVVHNGRQAIDGPSSVLREIDIDYSWFFGNDEGPYPAGLPLSQTEVLFDDPGLQLTTDGNWSNDDFHLPAGAPAIDAGDPGLGLLDADGTALDVGGYAGPDAALD